MSNTMQLSHNIFSNMRADCPVEVGQEFRGAEGSADQANIINIIQSITSFGECSMRCKSEPTCEYFVFKAKFKVEDVVNRVSPLSFSSSLLPMSSFLSHSREIRVTPALTRLAPPSPIRNAISLSRSPFCLALSLTPPLFATLITFSPRYIQGVLVEKEFCVQGRGC